MSNIRDTLIECGVEPERADSLLQRLIDEDEGVAQHAFRETLRALTPLVLPMLIEQARKIAGRKK